MRRSSPYALTVESVIHFCRDTGLPTMALRRRSAIAGNPVFLQYYQLSRVRSSLSIKNGKVGNKYLLMVGNSTYVVIRDEKYIWVKYVILPK